MCSFYLWCVYSSWSTAGVRMRNRPTLIRGTDVYVRVAETRSTLRLGSFEWHLQLANYGQECNDWSSVSYIFLFYSSAVWFTKVILHSTHKKSVWPLSFFTELNCRLLLVFRSWTMSRKEVKSLIVVSIVLEFLYWTNCSRKWVAKYRLRFWRRRFYYSVNKRN